MDPKDKFKERYNEYLEERSKQFAGKPSSIGDSLSKTRTYSPDKFYVLGIIVGILIVGPAAAYLVLSNQIIQNTTPSRISSVNVTPVSKIIVTDAQIDAEMQKMWGPYYDQVRNDAAYRTAARKKILEDLAVSNAMTKYAINISQDDILNKKSIMFGSGSKIASVDEGTNESVRQILIRQEVEKKVASWRIVDIASSFKTQDENFETNKEKALSSLEKIRSLLESGKTMKQAYNEAKSTPGFDKGLTIRENVYVTKAMGWAPTFSDAVFNARKGDITAVTSATDAFMVATIIDGNNGKYNSYDEWLASQTK